VERLSQHGDHLAALVRDNADRVEVIGTVGQAALNNMEQLRAQLPVIASATKDLTNNIGNTGRVAQAHLTDMVHGLNRLNDLAWPASVRSIAARTRRGLDAGAGNAFGPARPVGE
jgi:hypothetical protein